MLQLKIPCVAAKTQCSQINILKKSRWCGFGLLDQWTQKTAQKETPKTMDADFHKDVIVALLVVTDSNKLETVSIFTSTWEGFVKLCCIHRIFCNY